MKLGIKQVLQRILGLSGYLFLFAIYKILALSLDRAEGQFLHLLVLIPEDGIVLDIGANIGIMSVHLARKVGQGTVYAFEPMPTNFQTLERIIRFFRLRNVILQQVALGSENRDVAMVMPVARGGVRLQGLSHVVDANTSEEGDRVIVPCRRLDDMPEFFAPNCHISAIKIDVESFEYYVFDGARNLLATHHPIIYSELGENRSDVIALLQSFGYRPQILAGNLLVDFDPVQHANYSNFFFLYPA
jgi:FkbM family methyltransferase